MPKINMMPGALPVLPQGSAPASSNPKERMRQACQEFESLFIYKLLERMRATVPQEGYLHSAQEDVYQAICDQQVATALARSGGIGLGEMLYRQLSRQQTGAAEPQEAATEPTYRGCQGADKAGR